jgi:NAD(P)-dependent dehydrogenase (short-subunit alcohol dehydrogenase family)
MSRSEPLRVIVTGAAGAFGRATTARLERGGARVVGLDRAPDGAARVLACDVTDPEQVARAVGEAVERLGGLDVLVNNAGIGTAGLVAGGVGREERAVMKTNFLGAWTITGAALPHLLSTGGQVVNVASLLAVVTVPYTGAYTASKRALVALSDVLRAEHPGRLAVSTVYPGYAATAIHGPAEARSGRTLHGFAPEETPEHAARAIERAIRTHARDVATTRGGALVLRAARLSPRLVDGVIARRIARLGLLG